MFEYLRGVVQSALPGFSTERELEAIGAHRFRVDFIHRPYSAQQIRDVCEQAMNGRQLAATHEGNWSRGLQ